MAHLLKIVDAFYPDPDLVRAVALRSEYVTVANSYGFRSPSGVLPRGTVEKMQALFGFQRLQLYPDYLGTTCFYHSFRHGTKSERFYAHLDSRGHAGYVDYSLIVYLTPKAPRGAGTALCRHKETGLWQDPSVEDGRRLGRSGKALRAWLESEGKDRTKWDMIDNAENVYNRAVLFPAHWYHSGLNYFGNRLENGRLYQAYFFRADNDVFARSTSAANNL